jgi:rod shape-determining protein MreC
MNSPRSIQNITLALVITGIMLLALSGYLLPLTKVVMAPFIGVQTWLSSRYLAIQQYITTPRDVTLMSQEIAELKAEIARLQSQNIALQQENSELQVLSALLKFNRAHPDNEYASAAVIGRDPSPFLHYIIINRGSDDGLRRGLPVVAQQGLIGRIAAVTAGAARVQLITDPGTSIIVHLQPSGADAILHGSITGEVTLDQIPQSAEVQPGDLVLTSGLGGSYPADILIGQVSSVRQRPFDLFQSASIQTVEDFSQLKIVLVITNFRPVDITPLIPTPAP